MSIKALSMVWERSKQSGSSLLMLLAIADYAKDDGTDAWPSLATLARKTRMSRRNAIEIIKKLEDEGELQIRRGTGPRGCNFYDLLFPGEVQFTTKKAKEKAVNPSSPVLVNPSSPVLVNPSSPVLVNPSSPESLPILHLSINEPSEGPAQKPPPIPADFLPEVDTQLDILFAGQRPGVSDPVQDIEHYMQTADEWLKVYKKRTGLWPEKNVQKPAIRELACQSGADLPLWDRVVTAWVKHGWNKTNVAGMIECYERGEIPTTGNKNRGKPHDHAAHQRDTDETYFDPYSGKLVHRDPATGELVPLS